MDFKSDLRADFKSDSESDLFRAHLWVGLNQTHKCDQKRSDLESDSESDSESDPKEFKAPLTKKSFFQLVEFALISNHLLISLCPSEGGSSQVH